jgi:hypothetical protein
MQTALDESTLSKVVSIADEVASAIGEGVDQDHLLMLTCLQLAYGLEKVSKKLAALERVLDSTESWLPSGEDDIPLFGTESGKEERK